MILKCIADKRLLTLALSFALLFPGYGFAAKQKGSHRGPRDNAQQISETKSSQLDDVVSGLAEFENRASKFKPDEWNFVLGYAAFRQGNFKDAELLLTKVSDKLPIAVDHILFYRAVSASRLGKPSSAIGFLDEMGSMRPDSVWNDEALFERAVALISLGRFSEARARIADYRRRVDPVRLFEADKLSVRSYIEEGDGEAAAGLLRNLALNADGEGKLIELAPLVAEVKRRFGQDIASWLDLLPQQMRIAQSFAAASQWDEAVARVERLLEKGGIDKRTRAEARWLLARGLRWTHRYDEAVKIMEELLQDPDARGFAGSVMNTLAITYTKRDEHDKAIALRRRMMEGAPPGSARAREMAYKIAFLVMDQGKYEEAARLWRGFLGSRGGAKRENAQWYLGWSYYMAGRYADAASHFEGMLKGESRKSRIRDRLKYWRGRALERAGRGAEARISFSRVIADHPNGYYAELASRKLKGDKRDATTFAQAGKGVKGRKADRGEILVAGRSHLASAAFFDRLGLKEEAARELRAASDGNETEILALASRNFAHDVAYRIAEGSHKNEVRGNPASGGRRSIWEAAYPRAYDPVTVRLTKGSDVSPMFVWSIMRNESAFRPEVVSPAGAVGLMQIMPSTANRLAAEVGRSSIDRRDLFRPAMSLAVGISYIRKISSIFPGNPAAWAASYNAGEEAAGRWIKKKSASDIEEWIEEIPYDETNLYVKKVMLSCWKYQKLYGV